MLSYEFGTNWSRFSASSATCIGPLIGYEVLIAFFLEATFLGVLLFGWNRVPPWLHVLSAIFVAIGTAISAFWILSANSWMQTPAGYEMRDGIAYPTDWLAVIFNPSFPYRFAHMLTAAYLTTSLVVLAVGARYLVAGRHSGPKRAPCCAWRIGMLAILAPLQLVIGDQHGLNTLKYQPIKIAAMEAHWDGRSPRDFDTFRLAGREDRDATALRSRFRTAGILILTHTSTGCFPGLRRAAAGPPAGENGVLRLPHHGRDRHVHDRGGVSSALCCGGAARCSRRAGICAPVAMLVARLRRGHLRAGW